MFEVIPCGLASHLSEFRGICVAENGRAAIMSDSYERQGLVRSLPPQPQKLVPIDTALSHAHNCLYFSDGRGAARAEDAQGTPTQSHISPRILVYKQEVTPGFRRDPNPSKPLSPLTQEHCLTLIIVRE